MTMIDVYGIPNCDTVRNVRRTLDARGVAHRFHDFKKEGVDTARLAHWAGKVGWQTLLNKTGTTFRKLDDGARADLDGPRALSLMAAHPSLIRRPVIETADGSLIVGNDREAIDALT